MNGKDLLTRYEEWLQVEDNTHSTIQRKLSQIACFIRWIEFRGITLADLDPSTVNEYLMGKSGLVAVIKQNRQVISEFIGVLVSQGLLSENPASEVIITGEDPEREYPIPTPEEIEAITQKIERSNSDTALRDCCLLELAYGSGARVGELHSVNIEHYDPDNKQILLKGKGRGEPKHRLVPVTKAFITAIEKYLAQRRALGGAIFVSQQRRRMTVGSIYSRIKHWSGRNPHIFRHAFASHLHGNGADIDTIAKMLGHERPSTTQIYTHISDQQLSSFLNTHHPRKKPVL